MPRVTREEVEAYRREVEEAEKKEK